MVEPSDTQIEKVYQHIRGLHRGATMDLALAVGGHVVEHLLGGDLELWRQKGSGAPSLRKLAARFARDHAATFSTSTLWRYLKAYAVSRAAPEETANAHVLVSHAVLVAGRPPDEQKALLQLAIAETWSPAALAAHLAGPSTAPPSPLLEGCARVGGALRAEAFRVLDGVSKADAVSALKQVEGLLEQIVQIRDRLRAAVSPPTEPAPPPKPARAVTQADFVLTGSRAEADAMSSRDVTTAVCSLELAGYCARRAPDVAAFLSGRWRDVPVDSPESNRTMSGVPEPLALDLDRAERVARHLHLSFEPDLPGTLNLCVAAELVSLRPELARRTSVDLGAVVPFADALPRVRRIWAAFCARSPHDWHDLRGHPRFGPAVEVWLRELPHAVTGRSACQEELLKAAHDAVTAGQAVRRAAEALAFSLTEPVVEHHLLQLVEAGVIEGPAYPILNDAYLKWPDQQEELAAPLRLTPRGEAILAGEDLLAHAAGRWWGGVQVTRDFPWRFDPETGALSGPPRPEE